MVARYNNNSIRHSNICNRCAFFTAPSKIAPGGVTGISTVINYLTNIPIGVVVAAINVPIIILGFFFLGRKLIIKTIISTIAFSILVDYGFKYVPVYQGDLMIASLFGGAFIGIGLGIVYTREGTTGGMDIINRLIQTKVPHVKLGRITLATDIVVLQSLHLHLKILMRRYMRLLQCMFPHI